MITYSGYTIAEVQEMECDGTLPQHIMIDYLNGDYDGSDDDYDDYDDYDDDDDDDDE